MAVLSRSPDILCGVQSRTTKKTPQEHLQYTARPSLKNQYGILVSEFYQEDSRPEWEPVPYQQVFDYIFLIPDNDILLLLPCAPIQYKNPQPNNTEPKPNRISVSPYTTDLLPCETIYAFQTFKMIKQLI
jgi:hypothetical protein